MSENNAHAVSRRICASFSQQGLMATFGARVASVAQGQVVITAPLQPSTSQQHGFAHAGLTFALGDSAAGYSALTLMPADQEVMTAEIKINLLAPGKGDFLRATGRVIKPGRRLMIVSAEVHAVDGDTETLVAVLMGTMVPVAISTT
ncbi:PaaI family thioesterase [Sedimentitalea nanhaiensis]|uniref:Uncharacterized domain 1-containing protein n=1 Tax=Sedimentitalea nanhaiensis TaxID=999627 RepID=A0A1I7AX13_9RHOB|nr:PaaI family thioesterase [Sedimentitalea nanhaiensis]SFT79472.1 uncharacterized domain 1-containing protein [Sedimentitalea nanhaiensis]